MIRSRTPRRNPFALVAIGALLALVAGPAAAQLTQFDYASSTARLAWNETDSTVEAYGVWVAWDGESFPEPLGVPDLMTGKPMVDVHGTYGSDFAIRVAATNGLGFGPASAPSISIRLVPPGVTPYDVDGNGVRDILMASDVPGRPGVLWLMTENGPWLQDVLPEPPSGDGGMWKLSGSTDVNDDGRADILWSDPATGAAELWLMAGAQVLAEISLAQRGAGWQPFMLSLRGLTGAARVVWVHQGTGVVELWEVMLEDGEPVIDASADLLTLAGEGWMVQGGCDLDGDRIDDLILRNVETGARRVWAMADFAVADEMLDFTASLDYVGCGDVDADGAQALVRTAPDHSYYQLFSVSGKDARGYAGGTAARQPRGDWRLIHLDDLDVDGFSDFVEWNPERGEIRLRRYDGSAVVPGSTTRLDMPAGRRPITTW